MMRNGMRWLLILVLCLMTANSLAEPAFVPQMDRWNVDAVPLDMTFSVETTVHMPFDEARTAQLNALLRHVSFNLRRQTLSDESWNRLAVLVDNRETMNLATRETTSGTQVQTSWLPDSSFSQAAGKTSALNTLLGSDTAGVDLFGMDSADTAWLDDGLQMLNAVGAFLEDYKSERGIKTEIKDMGVARLKQEYVVSKADAAKMADALVQACPEGKLRQLLASLTFSGQQKLFFWRNDEGTIIRAEYAGKCGIDADHMRTVSLLWRMRRDHQLRDDLTLKSPADKGRDRNTLTMKRALTEGATGNMRYTGEFTYEWTVGSDKTKLSGNMDLTSVPENDASRVTGALTVKQLLPDEKDTQSITLTPDLLIGANGAAPVVNGTVQVESFRAKDMLEQAKIAVSVREGEYFDWEMRGSNVDLAALAEDQLEALRQQNTAVMSSALIPHLVLLPKEDVLYLSAGLSDEAWQAVVDAAQIALE